MWAPKATKKLWGTSKLKWRGALTSLLMKSKRIGCDEIQVPQHIDEEELLRDKHTSYSRVLLIGAQETR